MVKLLAGKHRFDLHLDMSSVLDQTGGMPGLCTNLPGQPRDKHH